MMVLSSEKKFKEFATHLVAKDSISHKIIS
jgi:hypothetical protein